MVRETQTAHYHTLFRVLLSTVVNSTRALSLIFFYQVHMYSNPCDCALYITLWHRNHGGSEGWCPPLYSRAVGMGGGVGCWRLPHFGIPPCPLALQALLERLHQAQLKPRLLLLPYSQALHHLLHRCYAKVRGQRLQVAMRQHMMCRATPFYLD